MSRLPAGRSSWALAVAVMAATALLMLPAACAGPGGAPFREASFTATSATA